MYVLFFIFLCVVVTVIVGLSAHFARKGDDESSSADGGNPTASSA